MTSGMMTLAALWLGTRSCGHPSVDLVPRRNGRSPRSWSAPSHRLVIGAVIGQAVLRGSEIVDHVPVPRRRGDRADLSCRCGAGSKRLPGPNGRRPPPASRRCEEFTAHIFWVRSGRALSAWLRPSQPSWLAGVARDVDHLESPWFMPSCWSSDSTGPTTEKPYWPPCFINDLITVLALWRDLFPHSRPGDFWSLPAGPSPFSRSCPGSRRAFFKRYREPAVRVGSQVPVALPFWAGRPGVMGRQRAGLAGLHRRHGPRRNGRQGSHSIRRLRTLTFGLLTPFYLSGPAHSSRSRRFLPRRWPSSCCSERNCSPSSPAYFR